MYILSRKWEYFTYVCAKIGYLGRKNLWQIQRTENICGRLRIVRDLKWYVRAAAPYKYNDMWELTDPVTR
jgi:hypothetical protein